MLPVVTAAVPIPIPLAAVLADLLGVTCLIFGMRCLLAASGVISALAGRRSPLVPPTLSTAGKAPPCTGGRSPPGSSTLSGLSGDVRRLRGSGSPADPDPPAAPAV